MGRPFQPYMATLGPRGKLGFSAVVPTRPRPVTAQESEWALLGRESKTAAGDACKACYTCWKKAMAFVTWDKFVEIYKSSEPLRQEP